jgi:hypothetical protein
MLGFTFCHAVTTLYKVLFFLLSRSQQSLQSSICPSVTQSPVITKFCSSVCHAVPLITKFYLSFCHAVTSHYKAVHASDAQSPLITKFFVLPSRSNQFFLQSSVLPSVSQSPFITKLFFFCHAVTSHYKFLFFLLSLSHQSLQTFRHSVTQSPLLTKLFVLLSRSNQLLQSSVLPSVTQSPVITKFCLSFCHTVTSHYKVVRPSVTQ